MKRFALPSDRSFERVTFSADPINTDGGISKAIGSLGRWAGHVNESEVEVAVEKVDDDRLVGNEGEEKERRKERKEEVQERSRWRWRWRSRRTSLCLGSVLADWTRVGHLWDRLTGQCILHESTKCKGKRLGLGTLKYDREQNV
jgi:hypothetical protein